MRLVSESVVFGRHETFPMRFSWLPKGYQALARDPKVFESMDATVRLGVGRNMVNAIRYWLRASQMIEASNYEPTEMGKLILDQDSGADPYLEDEGTIWLLHWLIVSNAELATAFYWFFNRFQKAEFTSEELLTAFGDFVSDCVAEGKRPAKNTLKADSVVLPRMYTQSKITNRTPLEDALDSPFSVLRLMEHKSGDRIFVSRQMVRQSLPVEVLGFAVLCLMKEKGISISPIEELMYSRDNYASPGWAFRLSESDFVTKLEKLVVKYPDLFEVRESSGIHQLFLLREYEPLQMISDYYFEEEKGEAA